MASCTTCGMDRDAATGPCPRCGATPVVAPAPGPSFPPGPSFASPPPGSAPGAFPPPAPVVAPAPNAAPPGWYQVGGTTQWWDGVRWTGGPAPLPVSPFRSVLGLGRATQAALVLACIAAFGSFAAYLHERDLLARVKDHPGTVTVLQARDADDGIRIANLLLVVASLLVLLLLVLWLFRVFKNLHGALRAGHLEHTPGWAVGWWFVPFANLVKPMQVVKEAWVASDPAPEPSQNRSNEGRATPLVGLWWAALLTSRLAGWISNQIKGDAFTDIDQARNAQAWALAGNLLTVLAGVLLIVLIQQVCARQAERAHRIAAWSPQPASVPPYA